MRAKKAYLARTIVEEQGKILSLAEIEVDFSADYLDYMAEFARRYEGEIIQSDRPGENILLFKAPIGVIAGILPWNFPFFLIVRKMAPALVTGNTIVIKPSGETQQRLRIRQNRSRIVAAQGGLQSGYWQGLGGWDDSRRASARRHGKPDGKRGRGFCGDARGGG